MRAEIVCVSFSWLIEHLLQDLVLSKLNEERGKERQSKEGGRKERRERRRESDLVSGSCFFLGPRPASPYGSQSLLLPGTGAT